ncbi:MAG TPA: beta-galactosidase trimerization domain-containing protein, partial [Clostridia bacterium]|nr:beta-galactosidase trimerization domain-containing protein [Clostridia bacterium]
PWRMIQTNLREIDMLDIDARAYVRQLQDFEATIAMINVGGIIASYPTDLPFHYQSPYLKGDTLEAIIEACHGAGIRVIARTDFSKVRRPIFEQHPDWAYRTVEGKIVDYNGDVHACISGDYQQIYAPKIIEEIVRKLPVDGLFINMGGFQTRDYSHNEHGLCHCEACKRSFRAMFGRDLPKAADMGDPAYRMHRVFQRRVVTEHHRKIVDLCRSLNPQIAVNGEDFHRMESNTEYRRPLPHWQYSGASNPRVIRGIRQEAVVSNTSVDFIGFPWRHVAVSPALQALRMRQNLANLGSPDYYIIGRLDNHADRSGYEAIREAFRFHKRHEADYAHLKSVARALVLRTHPWQATPEEAGWIRALTEAHVLFDEATEAEALAGGLSKYRCVVLADTESMSDEWAQALDAFARSGGTVIASGRPGRYDANYEPRERIPLECVGIETPLRWETGLRSAMIGLSASDKSAFQSFPDTDVVFIDAYAYNRYAADAAHYGQLIPPQPFGPPERCYGTLSTDHPGAVAHAFGSGKGVYVPWLPGELYAREGYENSRAFLTDVLKSLGGLEDVAPGLTPMVEVTYAMEKDGKHALAQLVNTSGHFGTSYFDPVPVADITLVLPCEQTVADVRDWTRDGACVPFEQTGDRVTIKLDRLEAFAALKICFKVIEA